MRFKGRKIKSGKLWNVPDSAKAAPVVNQKRTTQSKKLKRP